MRILPSARPARPVVLSRLYDRRIVAHHLPTSVPKPDTGLFALGVPLDALPIVHRVLSCMISAMRKLLPALTLVASAVSVPAFAADWVYVTSGGNKTDHYVDRTSIRQVGGYKQAWERIDVLDPNDDWEKVVALTEYDCPGRRTRSLQSTAFYRNGSNHLAPGGRKWRFVSPESVNEAIFDFVCFGKLGK